MSRHRRSYRHAHQWQQRAARRGLVDIYAGGGLRPHASARCLIREQLPVKHLLTYTEAIMRVYNRYGRRDNKYKARIKILVRALTVEEV